MSSTPLPSTYSLNPASPALTAISVNLASSATTLPRTEPPAFLSSFASGACALKQSIAYRNALPHLPRSPLEILSLSSNVFLKLFNASRSLFRLSLLLFCNARCDIKASFKARSLRDKVSVASSNSVSNEFARAKDLRKDSRNCAFSNAYARNNNCFFSDIEDVDEYVFFVFVFSSSSSSSFFFSLVLCKSKAFRCFSAARRAKDLVFVVLVASVSSSSWMSSSSFVVFFVFFFFNFFSGIKVVVVSDDSSDSSFVINHAVSAFFLFIIAVSAFAPRGSPRAVVVVVVVVLLRLSFPALSQQQRRGRCNEKSDGWKRGTKERKETSNEIGMVKFRCPSNVEPVGFPLAKMFWLEGFRHHP